MGELEATRLAAWQGFLYTHAAIVEVLGHELEDAVGMPLSWYDALVHLSEAGPEGLRMQELASLVVLSQSGISRLVDRLEGVDYVERRKCPSDGRGTLAVLTPAGRAALEQAAPVHLRGVHEHFARHLDDREAATLMEVHARLLASLRPDRSLQLPRGERPATEAAPPS